MARNKFFFFIQSWAIKIGQSQTACQRGEATYDNSIHLIPVEYVMNYSGVDKNDQDSTEYSTTIQSHCWYLHIFFWIFDQVISCYCSWKKYTGKNYGCANFQNKLGIQLLNYAIEHDWKDHHFGNIQPDWILQTEFYLANARNVSFVSIITAMASIINQSQQPRYLKLLEKVKSKRVH